MLEGLLSALSTYLDHSFFLSWIAVYLGGVLMSFTPCTYPVAPLTVAFIGSHAGGSRGRGFFLSLVYVLGMACVYTALGAAAALSGSLFGRIQSNPWMYFIFANICILMGLSMLGVFSVAVPMPRFITRMHSYRRGKGYFSSFLVGAASGLLMGPCTTPVLGVLLTFVATRQNMVFGLGTFAGLLANIPKGGFWMARVSCLFGWTFLVAGEYFLIKAGTLWY